jgi:hypothetical protein
VRGDREKPWEQAAKPWAVSSVLFNEMEFLLSNSHGRKAFSGEGALAENGFRDGGERDYGYGRAAQRIIDERGYYVVLLQDVKEQEKDRQERRDLN